MIIEVPDPNRFVIGLVGVLTDLEASDTKILMISGPAPSLADFGHVLTVEGLAKRTRGQWLISLLEENRYFCVAQPIVSADTFTPIGHEFLLRGIDTDGSELQPGTLFESAADPRIFFNLDRAARVRAVEAAAAGKAEGLIFINFMPGSVYDPNVCLRTTVDAVIRNGIDPRRVVFEIVESTAFDDFSHLAGIANFYRKAGFRIALDDFGTGHNNLSTLLALRPDFLKLDKVLTGGISDDRDRQGLIETVVQQCASFGVETIGEGVEDAGSAETLRDLGVRYLQGYHFGRPRALRRAGSVADSQTISSTAA